MLSRLVLMRPFGVPFSLLLAGLASSSEMAGSPGENLWLDSPGLAARLTT
jgi:hypothetical protein